MGSNIVREITTLPVLLLFKEKESILPNSVSQTFWFPRLLHSFKLLEVIFKAKEHYLWVIISIFVILNFKTENWFI